MREQHELRHMHLRYIFQTFLSDQLQISGLYQAAGQSNHFGIHNRDQAGYSMGCQRMKRLPVMQLLKLLFE
ncbi:hypothetical protein D3C81_1640920 [compost metagenome]